MSPLIPLTLRRLTVLAVVASTQACAVPEEATTGAENAVVATDTQANPDAPPESCGTYKGMIFDKTNDQWVIRIIERYDDTNAIPHYVLGVVYVNDVIPSVQWWGDFTINHRTASVSGYTGATNSDAIIWSKNCLERPAKRKVGGELYTSAPFFFALNGSRVNAWDVDIIAREEATPTGRRPFWTEPVGVRFDREIDLTTAVWDAVTDALPK
jgi:hypothetical protein